MILLSCGLLFFTVFFSAMYLSHFIRRDEEEMTKRIANRLENGVHEHQVRLEKKDRISDIAILDHILRTVRRVKDFQTWVRQSGVPVSPAVVVLFSLVFGAAALLAGCVAHFHPILMILSTAGALLLPFGFLAKKRAGKIKRFSAAFPDAISLMGSSLRAGYSLQMAFEGIIEDSEKVIAEEFRNVINEMEIGQNFEDALKKMLERIDTVELRLFISSVIIQRESGGNLSTVLDNLESTIRERFELKRELSAATAQARLSGIVISLLPLFVGFFVFIIHRDYIMFFVDDPIGKNLLWLSAFGQLLGFFVIYKIVSIRM